MLPWGHLAVGYLTYTLSTRVRWRRPPGGAATVLLAFGTQLPDLVDKPLNWWFDLFDGRGFAHSLIVVTLFCVILFAVVRKYDRAPLVGALSIGLYTHLFADAWRALFAGEFERAAFLLWPLFPSPTYPKDAASDHLAAWAVEFRRLFTTPVAVLTSSFGVQILLVVLMLFVWALDGFPGPRTAWRLFTHRWIDTIRLDR